LNKKQAVFVIDLDLTKIENIGLNLDKLSKSTLTMLGMVKLEFENQNNNF
jgi:hypothetical protein